MSDFDLEDILAVFVDMDGTLLDTLPGLLQVYKKFLAEFNVKGTKGEFNDLNGLIVREVVDLLQFRHNLPLSCEELENKYRSLYYEFYKSHPPLFPHALETLKYLKSRGFKLVLVTSASQSLVDMVLENPNLKGIFSEVVTGDKVERGKPDPEIFKLALKQTGLWPHQAIVIEDAPYGVEAALRAGMYVIRHYPKFSHDAPRFHDEYVEVKNWETIHRLFACL